MFLVVGLGNPGPRYASTRHNFGFMAVDALAERLGILIWREKFSGLMSSGRSDVQPITLLKPQTFMNLSGESVQPASAFLHVPPSAILVVHDELDLPFGEFRLKSGGGHGGHNGLRSLIASLATVDFVRLRLGIGRPDASFRGDVADYVLSSFAAPEQAQLGALRGAAAQALEMVMADGVRKAMNVINQKKD